MGRLAIYTAVLNTLFLNASNTVGPVFSPAVAALVCSSDTEQT